MKKYSLLVLLILFLGCSSREYFTPTKQELLYSLPLEASTNHILDTTASVATTRKYIVLPSKRKLPPHFIAIDDVLSKNGNVLRVNNENIKFDSLIVTAKKRGNLIAILFGDNHFELYDYHQHKTIFKDTFGDILVLRKFIAQPTFYKDLLLIGTLDGKLVVFDLKANKEIRSVVVSNKDYFNNIIYLAIKGDNLVVASRDHIIVIAPGMIFDKVYDIKHVISTDKNIFVFTISGDVIKLNFELKELARRVFKYADIIAPMVYKNALYFLSRGDESYLIQTNLNLTKDYVYPISTDLDDIVFAHDGVFYIGSKKLILKFN